MSDLAREEKEERRTPSDSRYVLVSWMMWVSARATLTAALSPDSGLRMEDLSILRRLAMEEATASLCPES